MHNLGVGVYKEQLQKTKAAGAPDSALFFLLNPHSHHYRVVCAQLHAVSMQLYSDLLAVFYFYTLIRKLGELNEFKFLRVSSESAIYAASMQLHAGSYAAVLGIFERLGNVTGQIGCFV